VIIPEFRYFGGKQTETAAFGNSLKFNGVAAPHTREAYRESLLFGLGGGIGFAYFLFERAGAHPIHLSTRIHTKETEQPEFYQKIAARIRVPLELQNSSSATAASANLKRRLEDGQPAIVGVDAARLPYLGLHEPLYVYYSVIAYGLDEEAGKVMLSDRCKTPVEIGVDEFRQARETSWSPKFRIIVLSKPQDEPDFAVAVRDAIHECATQLRGGLGITNFGLRGMEKWATVLTSSKEKKSWPKIFAPGPTLYDALYSIFAQISARSDTGHAHRAFYADFLEEASGILSRPGLRQAAEQYRRADAEWAAVADAHLPSTIPNFAEAKQLAIRRRVLFEEHGLDAADEIARIRARLTEIQKEAHENFPISFQDSRTLLNDLRQRVLRLREVEEEALRSLESAMA
jgi:hypothetical protein